MSFEPAASPDTWEYNVGLWQSYAFRPVTLDDAAGEVVRKVIAHRVTGDFVANVGLWRRLAIGLQLPFVIYQTGDDPDAGSLAAFGSYSVPASALGDMGVLTKVTLLAPGPDDLGGFALALRHRLGVPTGDEASYLGEGSVVSDTRVLAEYDLIAASLHLNLGARFRAEQGKVGCVVPAGAVAVPDCPTAFGHELPFGLALRFRPKAFFDFDEAGRWIWFAELWGHVPLYPAAPFTNAAVSLLQAGAGARYTFDNDLSILAGVDGALVSGVGNPAVRATLSLGWAPRKHDKDDDGIPDSKDKCAEIPEDYDGFEDDDGCPEWDNDDDGVPDAQDQCEDSKEDEDGFQDDDGCADPDNDGDGILDVDDHCPNVKGIRSDDPTQRGCPDPDPDKDGVLGDKDKCPHEAEDPDGFQDDDGCPDPDNDGDGLNDKEDACPDTAGVKYDQTPADNGCPDEDGDGITDGKDACPKDKGEPNEDAQKHGCPPPEDDKDKAKKKPGVRRR